jgi:hypothetical protein
MRWKSGARPVSWTAAAVLTLAFAAQAVAQREASSPTTSAPQADPAGVSGRSGQARRGGG